MKKKAGVGKIKTWFVGVATVTALSGVWGVYKIVPEASAGRSTDGDNIKILNGNSVRLLGVNTRERGEVSSEEAKIYLDKLIAGKKIWLEQDRALEDRYRRELYWVWVDCEATPRFWEFNYMKLTDRTHRPGIKENPEGCKKGKLVNEEIIKAGYSKVYFLSKKGEMKYEKRLYGLNREY